MVSSVDVILDGATEPTGRGPTSLQRADTPVLDALTAAGETTLRHTVPAGLPAGTETAVPVLLGWTPPAPVARGALEAAARGIDVPAGAAVHRIDGVRDHELDVLRVAGFALHELDPGHGACPRRVLAIGEDPLPVLEPPVRVWPAGAVPPRVLDEGTVVIAARGAAAGAAVLLGARVVVPDGATGDTDSDLRAKAAAACAALEGDARRVVVHVGAPDAAAHRRDAEAKVCAIEAADRLVLGPLRDLLRGRPGGGVLRVGADHGCDPLTGRHDGAPVPWVRWAP